MWVTCLFPSLIAVFWNTRVSLPHVTESGLGAVILPPPPRLEGQLTDVGWIAYNLSFERCKAIADRQLGKQSILLFDLSLEGGGGEAGELMGQVKKFMMLANI